MEKIQLTKEQADVIEERKERGITDTLRFIRDFYLQGGFKFLHNQCLNSLSVEDLSICLLVSESYEVIPQYNVGDWIVFDNQYVSKITKISGKEKVFYLDIENERAICGYVNTSKEYIRYATPEEIAKEKKRRFWERLGREVDEYKKGDIVAYQDLFTTLLYSELDNREIHFPSNAGPNSFVIPIEKIRLVVPIEQRLDK